MCSWYEANARATKGETCADQMADSFQAHKNVMQLLSQGRAMRSALVKRLYCAVCAVFTSVLSTGAVSIIVMANFCVQDWADPRILENPSSYASPFSFQSIVYSRHNCSICSLSSVSRV